MQESHELPKIPRQLLDRLKNFTSLYLGRSSFKRERYFPALRAAFLSRLVSNPAVNSMKYRMLEAVLISMSERSESPVMIHDGKEQECQHI